MSLALKEARKAMLKGEVPIGAVAVYQDRLFARAHNLRESRSDPLGHAEIYLISKSARKLKEWRLNSITLYVTLEPCLMCMGALLQARVGRLVFGAFDPKAGACGSLYNLSEDLRLNHRIKVTSRVLEEDCGRILSEFFKKIRLNQKKKANSV